MNLTHCTLTGVDEHAPLSALERLSREYPKVEWGLLYSATREGTPGRYPSIATLSYFLEKLSPTVRVALHICGTAVHHLLAGKRVERALLRRVCERGGRVQLNFDHRRSPVDLGALGALAEGHPDTTFITQHNADNAGVIEAMRERGIENHAVLFDSSRGTGTACSDWPEPTPIACGYAGGLGPENVACEMSRIAQRVGNRAAWIDMESRLRRFEAGGVDWLDLQRCEAVLAAVFTCCAMREDRTSLAPPITLPKDRLVVGPCCAVATGNHRT